MSVKKMRDDQKTKAELLQEVETLRKHVAELKQTQETLRKSEEKWRSLLKDTPDIVIIVDRDDTIRFINHTVPGIKEQGVIGKKVYDYISPEHHDTMREDLERIFQTGQGASHEISGVGRQGALSWYQAQLGPIRQDGRIVAASIVTRDITERKRAEEALRKSEEKYRMLFEGTGTDNTVISVNGVYLMMNEKGAERLGGRPEHFVGKSVYDTFPKDAADEYVKRFRHIAESGETKTYEDLVELPTGNRCFLTNMRPVKDPDGNVTSVQLISQDITERKRAEEALRESEKKYKTLFQGAAEGIIVADTETKEFKYANPAICKMLGYTEEELERLCVRDIHPKKGLQHIISEFEAQARGEKTLTSSVPCLRKDGTIMYADVSTAMVLIDGRQYNVGFFKDITERRRAEEALRESESKYRTLVENLPQKIFLKDRNSVYISCNDNLAGDLKIKSEEIAGKTDYDFFPEELAEKYRADDKKIMASSGIEDIEERYIQDGQEVVIHTVKTPVKDAQGNVIGILGIFWDITEIKQAEEELDLYREKMAHAEQLASLGTLSATLTHELNQPLTAIRLSIENSLADLETTSSPDTVIEDLKDGLTGVSDAASIVKRFSNLAGKSSGKIVTEVNLKAVVKRIVKLLKESARRARVSLHLKGMDKLPPIRSNEKDLEQLFFSLVENAIQAADGKKSHQLIISGDVKDEHIELRFADDCCGIAPKNLDEIFEPFFTTRPIGERTGMGLCIVERIVSGAGGKIRVESKAGKGSTFFVTLPINAGRGS